MEIAIVRSQLQYSALRTKCYQIRWVFYCRSIHGRGILNVGTPQQILHRHFKTT